MYASSSVRVVAAAEGGRVRWGGRVRLPASSDLRYTRPMNSDGVFVGVDKVTGSVSALVFVGVGRNLWTA